MGSGVWVDMPSDLCRCRRGQRGQSSGGGGVKVGKAHVFLLQEELWVQLRLEAMAWRWTPNVND